MNIEFDGDALEAAYKAYSDEALAVIGTCKSLDVKTLIKEALAAYLKVAKQPEPFEAIRAIILHHDMAIEEADVHFSAYDNRNNTVRQLNDLIPGALPAPSATVAGSPTPTEGEMSDEEIGRLLLRTYDAQHSGMKHDGSAGINAAVGRKARELLGTDSRVQGYSDAMQAMADLKARAEAAEARLEAGRLEIESIQRRYASRSSAFDACWHDASRTIGKAMGMEIVPEVPAVPLKVIVK